ncbi:MAG: PH domain-containing protein [Actinomycetota bacterium]|nr:PH domain-containing protein [Actinomycetota bacterium]
MSPSSPSMSPDPPDPVASSGPLDPGCPVAPATLDAPVAPDLSAWQRLHPASAVVRVGPVTLTAILVYLATSAGGGLAGGGRGGGDWSELVVAAGLFVVGLVTWLVTRWRLGDGVLQIETGLLRRRSLRFPLDRVQAIDVVRPGVARVLGLAELRIRMAGGAARGRLAYLTVAHAEELRGRLLAACSERRSASDEPGTPGPPPSPTETVLYTIDTARLLGSLAFSGSALFLVLCACSFVAVGFVAPGAVDGSAAVAVALVLGLGTPLWRRLNGELRLSVSDSPEGLHLRAGLLETSAETILPGRVQTLRLVQPLTWRPFGWWRVEVQVAGKGATGRRDRAARKAGRALLPVGSAAQAEWIARRVLPGAEVLASPPPRRVRWKAPLRYRRMTAGFDARYAVTTSGRLRRVTDWVPLDKVQSIRWVQGPLQRRLGLASIHLDAAGRAVHAELRDRDALEASGWLWSLPERCRAARAVGSRG